MRKGQRWRVIAMQEMIEFFEMVSLNEAALCSVDRTTILQARLAMRVFQRAMNRLRSETDESHWDAELPPVPAKLRGADGGGRG